jgi:hypothetical protein
VFSFAKATLYRTEILFDNLLAFTAKLGFNGVMNGL